MREEIGFRLNALSVAPRTQLHKTRTDAHRGASNARLIPSDALVSRLPISSLAMCHACSLKEGRRHGGTRGTQRSGFGILTTDRHETVGTLIFSRAP